jgi:aminopeptidase-like protein
MTLMYDLLKKIYPLRLSVASDETDKANDILCLELPFEVHEFQSGKEYNGWVVPQHWRPLKAQIRKSGTLIYDGMHHPLGVAGHSLPFSGKIHLDELKKHLFYHPELPDALVYHCDYIYKPWNKSWGMSIPFNLWNTLEEGEYEVILETEFSDGTMKVLDYYLPGDTTDTIIFNAHNCHPGQANDDISGVVVGIETIQRLRKKSKRKFSYRLIIGPEHLGTVFFLNQMNEEIVGTFKYAFFLEMLGNDNRLALQESFFGNSLIDSAAHHYLKFHEPDYFSDKFRKIIGNDETVWEAPGYEIPCVSLSRFPYKEYHSNLDDEKIIHKDKLENSVTTLLGILDILETNVRTQRNFKGLLALSNPKYDLYCHTYDPSIRRAIDVENIKWNDLMNHIVRYFDGTVSILDIAIKYEIPYEQVLAYLIKFQRKGLISFIP